MTPTELKYNVETSKSESFFFTRKTMQFFGDTMKNYGVCSTVIISNYDSEGVYRANGSKREVWELFRKRAVKHGLKDSAYFDKVTFSQVYKAH